MRTIRWEFAMWKKIAVAGAVGAAVLGSGAAALAASGNHTRTVPAAHPQEVGPEGTAPQGRPGPGFKGMHGAGRMGRFGAMGRNLEHGEFVTREGGKDVTHDVIHGSVTAVSATSIVVTAADGFSLTFTVNGDTRVRARDGDKAADSITQIKSGDDVVVAGTKSGATLTANHVLKTKK